MNVSKKDNYLKVNKDLDPSIYSTKSEVSLLYSYCDVGYNSMNVYESSPGEFPFTSGIYKTMYSGSAWKIRQYAGFGNAASANQRFKEIINSGGNGISVAFDLPTQMGIDPTSELGAPEVGKIGVSVNSLEDMRILFEGIDLRNISVSMTINSTAAIIILMYQIIAEEKGIDSKILSGTIQNDMLKEYICRSTFIFPIDQSIRLTSNIFEYCAKELPAWNPISVSGYHFSEAGATASQEVAYAISNGIAYLEVAREHGLDLEKLIPKFTFFFAAKTNIVEEVAKFRVARKIWAELVSKNFSIESKNLLKMKIHAQTAGSQLTPYAIENNIARVTIQSLSAILGGVQSLHTNSYDEAIALPTIKSAKTAINTQKILRDETDLLKFIDPIGGSTELNKKMIEMEEEIIEIIKFINESGGAIKCTKENYQKSQIEKSALEAFVGAENAASNPVGDDDFEIAVDISSEIEIISQNPRKKVEIGKTLKLSEALSNLKISATTSENLLYPIKNCLFLGATVSDICDVLSDVWGKFNPN